MITKKVNRYYCEFCKKSGCNISVIRKHELACTLNPNRICRVCKMDHGDWTQREGEQKPLTDLLVLLPDPSSYLVSDRWGEGFSNTLTDIVNSVLPKLREISGDCPACIMAALRQKGIPLPMVTDFNFTKEMKEIWDDINETLRAKNYVCL